MKNVRRVSRKGRSGRAHFAEELERRLMLSSAVAAFAPQVTLGVGSQPRAVVTADVNSDGKLDLIVANGQAGTVGVLLGNGNGSFGAQATFATGTTPFGVAVADVNRDGKLDLLVANNGSGNVSVLLGNGNGTFGAQQLLGAGTQARFVAVADVNGDGRPDLVVANYGAGTVSVILGNGNGSFAGQVAVPAGAQPSSIAVGDFNRDGKLDLAVANKSGGTVSLLLGNGNGSFGGASGFGAGAAPFSVAAGDVNGDGKLDLVVAEETNGVVGVVLGNGNGTFGNQTTFGAGAIACAVVVGDINGDGKLDIAAANYSGNDVSVLLGNGNGSFQQQKTFATGTNPFSIGAGDVNRDGWVDLVVGNFGGGSVGVLGNDPPPYVVSITRNNPNTDTTSSSSVTFAVTFSEPVTGVDVGDFSMDMNGVTASTSGSVTGGPTTYLATVNGVSGNGTLAMDLLDDGSIRDLSGNGLRPGSWWGLQAGLHVVLNETPNSMSVNDVNGDGIADLVVTNYAEQSLGVMLGNGNGTFQLMRTFAVSKYPEVNHLVDVNGDGKVDALLPNRALVPGGVGVLLGNGNGTFGAQKTFQVGAGSTDVVATDLNGDGKTDLVVSNGGDASVSILLGNGNGTFGPQATVATGASPSYMVGADLNGDGRPDVVVANYVSGTVSVLLGNGNGTLAPQKTYLVGSNPQGIKIADVDRDGRLDLLVANSPASLGVLIGNGDGTFKGQRTFWTGWTTVGVAVGDVNGDGIVDAVVPSVQQNYVGILIGNGDGTFKPQITLASKSPSRVEIADMNGDGRPEILVSNGTYHSVDVLTGMTGGSAAGEAYTIIPGTEQTAAVSGTVYQDLTGAGSAATSKPLANVLVYVDVNGDGQFESGEPSATSTSLGTFIITGVAPGSYNLREVVPPGWYATNPASGSIAITLSSGQGLGGQDFYVAQYGNITGTTFNDLNLDSVRQTTEGALGSVSVYLDMNGNGIFDGTDMVATSDTSGTYSFANLKPGTYAVRPLGKSGWQSSGQAVTNVIVTTGASSSCDVGFTQQAYVTGTVYADNFENGMQDGGETGLPGVTVFADLNQNGAFDTGEPSTMSLAGGVYRLGLNPGVYTVEVVLPANGFRSEPWWAPGYAVSVNTLGVQGGLDFGIVLPAASISGTVFVDRDGSGTLNQYSPGDPSAQVYLDMNHLGHWVSSDPTVYPDYTGHYSFSLVPAGTYTVAEVLPQGWYETTPASGSQSVTVMGQDVSGVNFGNFQYGLVFGTIYNDANGNGVQDSNEAVLSGYQLYLDSNNDGFYETGEPLAVSDADGHYSFTQLKASNDVVVRSLPPQGWQPSAVIVAGFVINSGNVYRQDWGFTQLNVVRGSADADLNNDGVIDGGDRPGQGWVAWADLNNNGNIDAGEPQTVVDLSGEWQMGLPAGTYTIRMFAKGYLPTKPVAGSYTVSLGSLGQVYGLDFVEAAQPQTIGGMVYDDADGTGAPYGGLDYPLQGWRVYLDVNHNGAYDLGEPMGYSGWDGNYLVAGVPAGSYTLTVERPSGAGWLNSAPASGTRQVAVTAGQNLSGMDFADYQAGNVSGSVYVDSNDNGLRDSSEGGLGGVVVYVDMNSDGILDAGDFSTTTAADGTFTFTNVPKGSRIVRELTPAGYAITQPSGQSYIGFYVSPGSNSVGSFGFVPVGTVPGSAGADTILLFQSGGQINWELNGGRPVSVSPSDPGALTINGNGGNDVINLNYGGGNPLPAVLHLNGTFTINGLQGNNPLAGTKIEMGKSTVWIGYSIASQAAAIRTALAAGYNGGAWNGASASGAITSAAAAANAQHNTGIGWADSADGTGINPTAGSVELMYTLVGDVNLDKSVNITDVNALVPHYNSSGSWTGGDFNYDGLVNITDVNALVPNYNTSLGSQVQAGSATASASVAPPSSNGGVTAEAVNSGATGGGAGDAGSAGALDTSLRKGKRRR